MKKQIIINDQILSGNLGDGWMDNSEAAEALSEYMESVWREELSGYGDYDISINIDVQNAEGSSRVMSVDCDDMETAQDVESLLSSSNDLWERFCKTERAMELSQA
jgi:hypothetical protein